MADESRGTPTNFRLASTYTDDQGRRRVDRDGMGQQKEQAKESVTRSEVAMMIATALAGLRITGKGVSGSAKSGWAINGDPKTGTVTFSCAGGTATVTVNIQ